jgi:hypothetical protein
MFSEETGCQEPHHKDERPSGAPQPGELQSLRPRVDLADERRKRGYHERGQERKDGYLRESDGSPQTAHGQRQSKAGRAEVPFPQEATDTQQQSKQDI